MTPNELFDLSGRTALVTGSSRGIGREIALGLAGAGARVLLHGSRESAALRQTAADLRDAGGTAEVLVADIASRESCLGLAEAAQAIAPVDILVLNASVETRTDFTDITDAEFDAQIDPNLRATIILCQALLPPMSARGWGRVVLLGSIQETRPNPRMAVYAASKAAQSNLSINLAKSHAETGVTVNVLSPGAILTGRNREVLSDPQFRGAVLEKIPARRLGTPRDCVGAALLLCSDAGAYITGARLSVDGGWSSS